MIIRLLLLSVLLIHLGVAQLRPPSSVSHAVRYADQFPGADAGAKIAAAIADLPSTGGTVDARGLEAAHTIATDVFSGVIKNVTLLLGSATFTFSLDTTIPSNIAVIASAGTVLAPAATKTLTINSSRIVGFEPSSFGGAGTVVFGGIDGNSNALPLNYINSTVGTTQTTMPWGFYSRITRNTTSGSGGTPSTQDTVGGFFLSKYSTTGKGSGLWGVIGQAIANNTDVGSPDAMAFGGEFEVFNNKAAPAASWWTDVNANGVSTSKIGVFSAPKGTYGITAHFSGQHGAVDGSNRPRLGVLILDSIETAYKAGSADWAEANNTTLLMTNAFVADPPRKASGATTTRDSFPILLRGASWDGTTSKWHGYKLLFDSTGNDLGKLSFQYLPAYTTTSSESVPVEKGFLNSAGDFSVAGSVISSGKIFDLGTTFRINDEAGPIVFRNRTATDKWLASLTLTRDGSNDLITLFGGANQGAAPVLRVNGSVVPGTSGRDLGSSSLRWDAFLNGLDIYAATSFAGTITHAITAPRTWTLPDATGNIPALPTAATTETGSGAIVRAVSPTSVTLDAEASGNVISIPEKQWLPAAICSNATADALFAVPTANGGAPVCYGSSPQRFGAMDFPDGATALTTTTHLTLPADWTATGGVDIRFIWFSGSASTNSVVWTVATACVADGEDLLAPTFNATQTVSDANNTTANTRNSAGITGVTTTGCSAGETLFLRIGRDPTAGDTLAATAALVGVEVTYRRAM